MARRRTGQQSFSAMVGKQIARCEKRSEAVFKLATQELFILAVNNAPYKTGFLKASFVASNGAPTPLKPTPREASAGATNVAAAQAAFQLVINDAKLGDTIYGNWTAVYARRIEYGFVGEDSLGRKYNQKGNGMTRRAAQKWKSIVREQAQIVRARYP